METVIVTILDQEDQPVPDVSGVIYDDEGGVVTTVTSSEDGEIEVLLPSSVGDGTLYYLRVYKSGYIFDRKYGFRVVTGEDNSWQLSTELLELTPSLNPNLCLIQGDVIYPDGIKAKTSFKIHLDDDIGAFDGSYVLNTKEVTTSSGTVSFELPRDCWVSVSSPGLPEPKFCHVKNAAYMSLLDFLLPIVSTVEIPGNEISLAIGETFECSLLAVRTDGAVIPAEPIIDPWGIEEYLKFEIDDPEIVAVQWLPSGLSLKGLSSGATSIYLKHRDTRQYGPLLRLPQNTETLLEIQITVE